MIKNKTHQDLSFVFLALSFYFLFLIFKLAEFSLLNPKFRRNYNFSLFFVFFTLVIATIYILRNISTYSTKGVDSRNLALIIITAIVYFIMLLLMPSIL